jgi:hypothetical protein
MPYFRRDRQIFATGSSLGRRNRCVLNPVTPHRRGPTSSRDEERTFVPDFEIRYFHSDGTLGLVHITSHKTRAEAEAQALRNQDEYAHFEVHEIGSAS